MSLINDALKRASQAQPPPLPDTEKVPPMRHVETKRPSNWPLFVVPVVLLCVLGLAGWFLLKGLAAGQKANLGGITTPVAARELPAENPATPEPVPDTPPAPPPTKGAGQPASPKSRTSPKLVQTRGPTAGSGNVQAVVPGEAVAPESSEPTFPSLRLQGLFYRPTRASVVINSKTLYVGDRIENAKVVAIERDSVVVEWGGEKRVLTLN